MKVVFLDRIAIRTALRPLSFSHEWIEFESSQKADIVVRLRGARVAITNRTPLGENELSQLPDLKLIAVAATGYDCVDLDACRRYGIAVTNIRDWSTTAVAEHALAMMLALRRQLFDYRDRINAGEWQRSTYYSMVRDPLPRDLAGSVLGVVGNGAIGQRIAQLCAAFDMNILVAARKSCAAPAGRVPFDEVLRQSDILCVCCPLTPETSNLIGEPELSKMKSEALLINCSRGGIVEDDALARALDDGRLAGAGVDVLGTEPPSNGNRLTDRARPNLIVTPHVAFASRESIAALGEQLMQTIEAFIVGRPRNIVS